MKQMNRKVWPKTPVPSLEHCTSKNLWTMGESPGGAVGMTRALEKKHGDEERWNGLSF